MDPSYIHRLCDEDDYIIVDSDTHEVKNTFVDVLEDFKEKHNSQLIIFDALEYIDSIYDSYKNKISIYNQWKVDFHRQIIKINNIKVNDFQFIEFVTSYNQTNKPKIDILLLMLTTQAMFFYPFSVINTMCSKNDSVVIDAGKHKIIHFTEHKTYMVITFNLIVNIFDIAKECVVKSVSCDMILNLNLDNYKINKYGFLTYHTL